MAYETATSGSIEVKDATGMRMEVARLDISIKDLAALTGMHRNTLSDIMHGHAPLTRNALIRIRVALAAAATITPPPQGQRQIPRVRTL